MLLHYIAGAADRGRPIVSMFHNVISGTGYDKAGGCADIKRILSVGGTFTLGAPLKIFYSKMMR